MNEQALMMNLDEYKAHLFDFNKYSYTLMSMILGHDLGLFSVLNEAKNPLTSSEIAERATLKERYVKEWLGAMTAARVVCIQKERGINKYSLPQEYFDVVLANVALGKGVGECVRRTNIIKACFKRDGPMGDPSAFDGDFWKFFGEFRTTYLITKQVKHQLLPLIQKVDNLQNLLVTGCNVLDIGCGNGALTIAMSKQYPKSFFTGIDTAEDSIKDAKAMLDESEYKNITFQRGSTTDLVKNQRDFGVVFMSQVLHNLPDPLKMIEEVHNLLKTNGTLILLEIRIHSDHAENVGDLCAASQYSFSHFFCLPFSMSDKPHQGYGMGWGIENLQNELEKYFTLDFKIELEDFETFFVLSKTIVKVT